MENSYGIGVQNRYGMFLDDEADPFEVARKPAAIKPSEEKENKVAKTKSAPKKPVKGDVNGKADKTNGVAAKGSNYQARHSENRPKFSDREERNNRRNRQEGPRENGTVGQRFDGEERPRRRYDNNRRFQGEEGAPRRFNNEEGAPRRFEGEGRGGRGRGMGRGRGGRGGRRDFDRHSGSERSGVKSVDKREGGGSYNWGNHKDQMEEGQEPTPEETTEEKPASGNEDNAETTESGNEAPKEPEEPKEMTLDEYKAMQQASRVKPEFNVRKAGEGENNSQWKKTYVLKKKVDYEEEEEESSEEEEEEDEEAARKKNLLLSIDFQFNDSPMRGGRGRGRGGRGSMGGRGRGEGRGGRGGYNRGPRTVKQEAPKMDNKRDFPTLGGRK